jgi:hypothetical protein
MSAYKITRAYPDGTNKAHRTAMESLSTEQASSVRLRVDQLYGAHNVSRAWTIALAEVTR